MSARYTRPASGGRGVRMNPGRDTRFSENRVAWLSLQNVEVVIMRYDDDNSEGLDKDDVPGTPSVNLSFPHPGNRAKSRFISLTGLTELELAELRNVINLACDLAEPIVRFRDKVAKHGSEQGDDSFARLYRAVPEVFTRQGAKPEDLQELRSRFERPLEALSDDSDSAGGTGGGGSDVADEGTEGSSTENDPAESDES